MKKLIIIILALLLVSVFVVKIRPLLKTPPPTPLTPKPKEFLNSQKYLNFKAEDFEIKYPDWPNVEKKYILEPDKTKIAVTDGGCSFALSSAAIPANTTFKDYSEKQLLDSMSQLQMKVIDKEIASDTAYIEADLTMGNVTAKSISYAYLTTKDRIYSVAFVAVADQFEEACRPVINESIKSVSVK